MSTVAINKFTVEIKHLGTGLLLLVQISSCGGMSWHLNKTAEEPEDI